jgi:mannosyltransferase OCH1-like enzyme
MESWKEKLADYEYVLWNFDRFDINLFPWVKQAFEAKKYAFAADVIRLFAVYHYGGIYLDMDVEVVKPFDDLLQKNIIVAYENNTTKQIEAGCFGAEQGHPYIKACLDYFNGREFNLKIIDDGYTLPRVMKKVYRANREFRRLPVYTEDYFTAKQFRTGVIKTTENTYAIHHFAGSWFSRQEQESHKAAERIAEIFGANIFSACVILCMAFVNRVKKYGFCKAVCYYINKLYD